MLGYLFFNLLHLQRAPLPRFEGEGAGFGMDILDVLSVSWARWQ